MAASALQQPWLRAPRPRPPRPEPRRPRGRGSAARAGMTLIETLIATALVTLLAGALGSAGHVILSGLRESDRLWEATELGMALLEEIASLPFDDPQTGEGGLGPEEGEWTADQTRALFDDVDDYTVWTYGQPLQAKDGTRIDAPGYLRAVAIDYVASDDFGLASMAATDHKRIVVSVYCGGELLETFSTVRTQGGRDVDFDG